MFELIHESTPQCICMRNWHTVVLLCVCVHVHVNTHVRTRACVHAVQQPMNVHYSLFTFLTITFVMSCDITTVIWLLNGDLLSENF